MSKETQRKIAVACAWLGAMLLLTLWAVSAYGQACAPRMTAADCARVDPAYGQVVYDDARADRTKVIEPGTSSPLTFEEPLTFAPTLQQCGQTVQGGRWLAICFPGKRHWAWVGPPPAVPCNLQSEGVEMFGYKCVEGNDGVAGFQGRWVAARRGL